MWIFTLFLLVSLNGVFASSDICQKGPGFVCPGILSLPSFPETEEDLERVCVILQRTFQCVRNYEENCAKVRNDTEITDSQAFDGFTEAVTEICRKDTRLHSNVVQNLPCLKDIFEHAEQTCQGYTRNAINHLYQQVMDIGSANADDYHVYRVFDCLYIAVQTHCYVTQTVQKCGSRAKDAVLEIMEKSRLVEKECPAAVQREVLELLNVLVLETEEEIHVKGLFQGKK